MNVVVFLGPTLPVGAARSVLDASYLQPAGHGDIYRAALARPRAIALIDGYFRSVAAVRHKEILWAMAEGIHVFGAASMGALRATELAPFGMVGIGRIFDAFSTGALEDDDEVAIEHGPAELGYTATSDAMVNIRATFEAACQAGVIDLPLCQDLVRLAKQMPYAQRNYTTLLECAAAQGLARPAVDRLLAWLPSGRVDLKQEDALNLLGVIRDFLVTDPPPLAVKYVFARTEAWERDVAAAAPAGDNGSSLLRNELLDEVRLVPGLYRRIHEAALARALALREANRQGIDLDARARESARVAWQHAHGLTDTAALTAWQRDNHIEGGSFAAFVSEEERRRQLAEMAEPLIEHHLLAALRASGDFASIAARAADKRHALESRAAAPGELGLPRSRLLAWYCSRRMGRDGPVDADALAAELGFVDATALCRALALEFVFVQAHDNQTSG
jgi:hypothetical protein